MIPFESRQIKGNTSLARIFDFAISLDGWPMLFCVPVLYVFCFEKANSCRLLWILSVLSVLHAAEVILLDEQICKLLWVWRGFSFSKTWSSLSSNFFRSQKYRIKTKNRFLILNNIKSIIHKFVLNMANISIWKTSL